MTSVCFYFQVHQPRRLRRVQHFRPPAAYDYWDERKDREILDRASRKCYLPANALIKALIEESDGAFRVAYSLSGVFLEQLERYRPDVLASFQALADTGHVEFLGETYYHSLSGLWEDPTEHKEQIALHQRTLERLFGVSPRVFRNTELIYDNRIAHTVSSLGYDAIVTEGADHILGGRSPRHLYRPQYEKNGMKVLLKDYKLSDDIAFRFSTPGWPEAPLTADKYANWLAATPGETINLFMDYETFGEHQWPETGIFEFLKHLPKEVARHPHLRFALPSEVVAACEPVDTLDVPFAISWADTERDVSAWLHNKMQQTCFERLKAMAPRIKESDDADLLHAWRLLQTSDHLYYCSTKSLDDQDIHSYFSPYDSPYLAFINYMNAIDDLERKAQAAPRRVLVQPVFDEPVAAEPEDEPVALVATVGVHGPAE